MNKTTLRWGSDAPKRVANAWQESRWGPIAINAPKRVYAGQPHSADDDRERPLSVPRFPWYYLARSERRTG